MSVLAVAVKHLVALGMSGDALAAAIAEMQAAEDTRSTGAKRQQRYRDRLAARDAERNEASQSVTRDDSVTRPPVLDKETSPRPPKEIKPTPRTPRATPRDADPFPKPEWADAQVWADFLANRKRKRLANTATAHAAFLADVARHADDNWPPGRLLTAATAKGHGAIYASIKDNDHASVQHRHRPAPRTGDGFINALHHMSGDAPAHDGR